MRKLALSFLLVVFTTFSLAQTSAPAMPPMATDVSADEIKQFIDSLPRDRVSDRPIRVVEVTGGYRIGVYGVFRPRQFPGGANLHPENRTEIYYILEGSATLVTGGKLIDPTPAPSPSTSIRGSGIEGGVTRQIEAGDVVIIPGHTPHWFSALAADLSYLIYRPDPDSLIQLK
ncbi:MAG: hypothetical protein IIC60_08340 [Proteobacteria bacterium]|nr:hypothetical protein [Pseudomonadota bacterium]